MAKLTQRDRNILTFITEQITTQGESPTLAEIKTFFGFNSATTVQRAIKKLEAHGLVVRNKHKSRSLSVPNLVDEASTVNVPILAGVACGAPNLAVVEAEGYVPTDRSFLQGGGEFYYVRAMGDSMNQAGIEDGDLVLVRRGGQVKDGDRVVALLDDLATIKVLKRGDGYVALVPKSRNAAHKPIILREDFAVQGVVCGVFGV